MFRHFPPNKTMLKLIRLNIKAFFIYTTCLSDPVEKSSKLDLQGVNSNPNNPQVIDIEKKITSEHARDRSGVYEHAKVKLYHCANRDRIRFEWEKQNYILAIVKASSFDN